MLTFDNVTVTLRRSSSLPHEVVADFTFRSATGASLYYFTLTLPEMERLVVNGDTIHDGYRRIEQSYGEGWLIYSVGNLRCAGGGVQERTVQSYDLQLPHLAQRALLRYLRWVSRPLGTNWQDRLVITLSKERRARWLRLYGCGTGQLKEEIDFETRASIEEELEKDPSGRLVECLEGVRRIALNSTSAFFQTAQLAIWGDGRRGGYDWVARRPNGSVIMNGGIIDHGKEGSPSWSTHT